MAQDWPQWRGLHRDAKASFQAPQTWPQTLARKWKVPIGDGVATPALVGEKLYVFTRQQDKEVLRCLNVADGKEIWKDEYESQGASGPSSSFAGPRSSPAVGEGKVVTLGVRGVLSCLDAASGKVLWRKDDFKGATPRFFTSSSPLIVDGLCIAQLGGGDSGALAAYELATGQQKWKWTGEGPAYASPILMTIDGKKLVIAQTERRLVGVQVADGKLAWEVPFAIQGARTYNAATPIVDGQTLILSGGGRGTQAFKLQKEGETITATELWKNPDQSVQFNTPVLKDAWVYGLSQSDVLFCLDKQTGKAAWTMPVAAGGREGGSERGGGPGGRGRGPGGRGGGGFGSIVDAGSVLLALTPASQLIAFAPGEKQYAELARIKVADSPTHAYPVLSGNRVFIKDQDSVAMYTMQ